MSNYPENWEHTIDLRPEDYLVNIPIIGDIYHISWAKNRGMCWKLLKTENEKAYLETPKTHKPISCKVSELRESNRKAMRKARKRPYLD